MAKYQIDAMLDAGLDYIKTNATQESVCSAQPTTYAEATATYKLALKTGLVPGSFTIADGDAGGRKIIVAQQAAINVDASGTATHVALCSGSVLLFVTTCTSQALVAGNTVTIPAWKDTLGDAS